MPLPDTGYIQVHAYTSYAQIPLKDVAVTVTDNNGNAIAMRLTNRSGQLDDPIPVETPDRSAGLSPNTDQRPFTTVGLTARLADYELIDVKNLQVFPGTITDQNLEMIPLAEFPESFNRSETFETNQQAL